MWERLSRIMGREGTDRSTLGRFYIAVVHETLLFGSETWLVTTRMSRTLGGFHHWMVQKITGKTTKRRPDGGWEYLPTAEALRDEGVDWFEI